MFETNFFSYKGRITRLEYFGINVVILIISSFFLAISYSLYLLWLCAGVVISSLVIVKRCHDVDLSGWYGLLFLVPIANICIGLFLLFIAGTDGPNKYGEDPKDRTSDNEKSQTCDLCGNILGDLERYHSDKVGKDKTLCQSCYDRLYR